MEQEFAKRFDGVTGSAIREIFKVLGKPNMISFAGGNPAADALPDVEMAEMARDALLQDGKRILQYGATEGYPPFLESLRAYIRQQYRFPCDSDSVLPISGSTQGMDLLLKALIDPGDTILVESPTFLGNMQTQRLYQAKLVPIESDGDGLLPDALETAAKTHHPKLLYTIPTFQNPTGSTLSADRRREVMRIAEKYDFIVAEDDPYRDLRYAGTPLRPIKELDENGRVVYMGSFSKIISPGMRVGYLVARPDILRKCVIGKQGTDLHTPNLTQAMVDLYLRRGLLAPHIESILPLYREKLNAMLGKLSCFPHGTLATKPKGGLFVFATLPEGVNATALFEKAVARGVAYVPGTHFYPEGGHHNTLRLNFSNSTLEQIDNGMDILGKLFCENC